MDIKKSVVMDLYQTFRNRHGLVKPFQQMLVFGLVGSQSESEVRSVGYEVYGRQCDILEMGH